MNYPVKFLTDIGRTTPNPSDLQRQSWKLKSICL